MPRILKLDHVGITVADLKVATDFFLGLGLEVAGRHDGLEGEFLDTVCGLHNARTRIVMLNVPGTEQQIELSSFIRPGHGPGLPEAMATEVGLRSLAFVVDDLPALVDQLRSAGYGLVGGIGEYEGVWRMAYVRGPEGIIVALAQRLD